MNFRNSVILRLLGIKVIDTILIEKELTRYLFCKECDKLLLGKW